MKKRFLILFLFFNIFGIVTSCFPPCPPEKYFDYDTIIARVNNPSVLPNEKLTFGLIQEDIKFITEKKIIYNFTNSAYATSKCEKGYDGEKFKLIRILITGDKDFNSDLPAGSDLSSIVKANGYNSNNEQTENTINNLDPSTLNLGYMRIEGKPTIDKKH